MYTWRLKSIKTITQETCFSDYARQVGSSLTFPAVAMLFHNRIRQAEVQVQVLSGVGPQRKGSACVGCVQTLLAILFQPVTFPLRSWPRGGRFGERGLRKK